MNPSLEEILGAALVAFLSGLTLVIRAGLKKMNEKKRAEHDPTPLLQRDRRIMEAITELRVRMDADRAAVHQFHNGQYFSSGRPLWRSSCTHETCGPGVAYRANEQRAIIASNILDLIMPLWGHKIEGVHQIECGHCMICQKIVWECRTEDLPAGPSKAMLQAQGVDFSLRTVLTGDGDYPIGYLVMTWDRMPEETPYDVKPMCDAAEILNYLLSQNGLEKIQEPSPEPSAFLDAYTPR